MSGWSERVERMQHPRPYDLGRLARVLGLRPNDTVSVALAVGIGRRWVRRYRTLGLTEAQADRWATRCGFHPLDVWPEWGSHRSGAKGRDLGEQGGDLTSRQVVGR